MCITLCTGCAPSSTFVPPSSTFALVALFRHGYFSPWHFSAIGLECATDAESSYFVSRMLCTGYPQDTHKIIHTQQNKEQQWATRY